MFDMKTIGKIIIALILAAGSAAYAAGEPGKFDYYVLTLSWSPEHCAAAKNDHAQCGADRHYGFVVHGLWPQYEKGYPDSCATRTDVPHRVVEEILPIMPSKKLIRHEWEKHGTCSGKDVSDYFEMVRSAYHSVRIPRDFAEPGQQIDTTAANIRREFVDANPGLQMAVACKGKFLQEVRVCLDKDMHSRKCSVAVRDRCPENVIMRPTR